jgi:hypothetical protein
VKTSSITPDVNPSGLNQTPNFQTTPSPTGIGVGGPTANVLENAARFDAPTGATAGANAEGTEEIVQGGNRLGQLASNNALGRGGQLEEPPENSSSIAAHSGIGGGGEVTELGFSRIVRNSGPVRVGVSSVVVDNSNGTTTGTGSGRAEGGSDSDYSTTTGNRIQRGREATGAGIGFAGGPTSLKEGFGYGATEVAFAGDPASLGKGGLGGPTSPVEGCKRTGGHTPSGIRGERIFVPF